MPSYFFKRRIITRYHTGMSEISRRVNRFFSTALRSRVNEVRDEILLTERQQRIFDMFYVERRDITFIADTLFVSPDCVKKELRRIRRKLIEIL